MIKKIIGLLALIIFSGPLFASHLVGGSLGYEYLGPVGANFRYKIILTVYNNCDGSSLVPLPVPSHNIGVYFQDIPNNPMGGGNKTLLQSLTLNLVDSNSVVPPTSSGCVIGQGVCIIKGVYEGFIDVPLNFNGYHLYFQNFARNASITNLLNPGGTAMAFHAYIPPTLVNNSSPVFQDDPVPFLCVNDTASILNTAIDPDGDQLIFSFVTPMAGSGGAAPNPLPWAIAPVGYNGGFSPTLPFGGGGHSFIDGVTGLTEYMSPNQGNYVVAVEIREIRNGKLIGISRRDLQLLVINCPPNPAPNLSPNGGSGITQYTIQECDTLVFPITFTDANGDSLSLSVKGQIFDTSFVNPAATIDSLVLGDSTVTANFVWETSCGTAQALPYLFTASVTDNGCPPKTTNVVYQITVEPPTPPDSIIGPLLICSNTTANYTTDTINGFTFNWVVTGGTINSGQGSTTVNVTWGSPGTGTITVNSISDCGCPSATIDTAVTILAAPIADAGPDVTICLGDTVQIGGSPTNPLGTIVSWLPNTNISNVSASNPFVFPTITTDYIVTVDNGTCPATDTVRVNVGSANVGVSADTSICLGDSTQLIATGGGTYSWTPALGLSDTTIANPIANPLITTVYTVTIMDTLGCVGIDTITVTVNTPPTITITNDTTICDGDCVQLLATGGGSYVWSPAAGLSNPNIANPIACLSVTTTYFLTVTNASSCTTSDSVLIIVNPLPTIATNNDTSICGGNCVQLTASGGTSYTWTPTTGLSNATIPNPIACPLVTTTYIVTGMNANGCFDTTSITVTINPLPIVDAGIDAAICIGDSIVLGGSPTGPVGSTFSWTPAATLNDSTLANPTATPLITTTYTVIVTNGSGCIDSNTVTVTINSLPIVDAGIDTAICAGTSVVIGGNPTGTVGSTFSWSPSGTLNNPTLANPTATPTVNPTNYVVIVTDTNGCENSDSVIITINPLPIITTNNDTSICIGDCAQLTASGGTNYTWTPTTGLSNATIFNPIACPLVTTTYIATGTDANGCFDTASVTVTINPLPIVDAGIDAAICIGDSIVLGGSPTGPVGSTFSWTPAATLNDSTLANPTATPLVTTAYIVTVINGNGCVNSDTVIISLNPLPTADAGVDTSLCIGTSVIIGGNPTGPVGSTFSWAPSVTLNNSTLSNPTATPLITTTYIVVITDTNGCIATDSVQIMVNPLPTIITNNDTSICIGDSIQLNATGGVSYIWTPNVTITNPTIPNPIVFPTVTTTYIVTGTDANGCFDITSVTITIDTLPIINAGPDVWVCSGDSVQLLATGGTTYAWSPSLGLNNVAIPNPLAGPLLTTTYIVTGFNTSGCSSTDTIIVTASDTVPISSGIDTTICAGDSIVLGGSPTSPNGTTFSWFPTTSLDDPTLANPTAFPTVTTTYFIVATNDTCTTMDSVTITVNSALINAGTDVSICVGDSIQLTATGGVSYEWHPGIFLTDSVIPNPIAFPTITTNFIVEGTDNNGCSATDTVTVNVNALPIIDAGTNVSICIGDSVQLTATGGNTYTWTPTTNITNPNIDNPFVFPTITTTYFVTGIDGNTCSNSDSVVVTVNQLPTITVSNDTAICIGDAAQLNVTGGTTFSWTPTATLNNGTIANPLATPITTTTYQVLVMDPNGCDAIDTVRVTINALPIINAGNGISICIGDTAQLNATGGNTYLWTPATGLNNVTVDNPLAFPTVTTQYTVIGTDTNLCVNTDVVTITVNQLPIIDAGADVTLCVDDSVQLNATGGTLYIWTPITNITNPNAPSPFVFPTVTTTYFVTGFDGNGCSNSDSVLVSVFRIPDLSDTTICIGDNLQLIAFGPSNANYIWTPATNLSDPTIFNPITNTAVTITYVVTVEDIVSGCFDSTAITVEAFNKPTADFSVETVPGCEGILANFTNLSTNASTFLWVFGDGEQSTTENPSHIFAYGGDFTTILTAFNGTGCFDTASFNISSGNFEEQFNLTPPSVFTPNGDGINDLFKIDLPSEIASCTNLQVFNRWGMKIFESKGQNIGWDGRTTAAKKVPAGTYFYIIEINGITKKGSLTLLE